MKDTGRSPGKKAMTAQTTPDDAAPDDASARAASPATVLGGDAGAHPASGRETAPVRRAASGVALAPEIQNRIGEQLRSLYTDLLAESTPDRFLKLLDELDRKK